MIHNGRANEWMTKPEIRKGLKEIKSYSGMCWVIINIDKLVKPAKDEDKLIILGKFYIFYRLFNAFSKYQIN